jgi:ATP-dependent protease ClpP protease subunit
VVGLAASAASVIACAGKSDIAPTAQMMVHNVSTWAAGNYHDMDHASNMLKQANRAIAAAYTEKSGMSEKDALDLMDAETWITAQDAVDYGLIDKIAGSQNSIQDEDASVRLAASVGGMLPPSVINKMQKRKQALLDYFSE